MHISAGHVMAQVEIFSIILTVVSQKGKQENPGIAYQLRSYHIIEFLESTIPFYCIYI